MHAFKFVEPILICLFRMFVSVNCHLNFFVSCYLPGLLALLCLSEIKSTFDFVKNISLDLVFNFL